MIEANLVIDRATWRFGGRDYDDRGDTRLYNRGSHKMCCLGFDLLRCGFTKEEIMDIAYPSAILGVFEKARHLVVKGSFGELRDSGFSTIAIRDINDASMDTETRECLLKEHYAKIGVAVEFVGEYPA